MTGDNPQSCLECKHFDEVYCDHEYGPGDEITEPEFKVHDRCPIFLFSYKRSNNE